MFVWRQPCALQSLISLPPKSVGTSSLAPHSKNCLYRSISSAYLQSRSDAPGKPNNREELLGFGGAPTVTHLPPVALPGWRTTCRNKAAEEDSLDTLVPSPSARLRRFLSLRFPGTLEFCTEVASRLVTDAETNATQWIPNVGGVVTTSPTNCRKVVDIPITHVYTLIVQGNGDEHARRNNVAGPALCLREPSSHGTSGDEDVQPRASGNRP